MTEQKFKTTFEDMKLMPEILSALKDSGYTHPTPIQEQAIPILLEGKDLLGCAQTGTGKTAAFSLPIIQRLMQNKLRAKPREVRTLILAPTRELAIQVQDSFKTYAKYLHVTSYAIYGGVGYGPQINAIRHGLDVLVATPGRLMDLINQRVLSLANVEVFVLDEADRMLDMGFINDIKRVVQMLPAKRHNLFFSATMPKDIQSLAGSILRDPVRVEVNPESSTVDKIDQTVMYVEQSKKRDLLKHVFSDKSLSKVIVFTRTKHGADRVVKMLDAAGVMSRAIHGNKSQNARQTALEELRSGKIRALIATDIAARGIDIDNITHVINFELPNVAESYVHRIGRTARAGTTGKAISFCDQDEKSYLKDIEKIIGKQIPVVLEQPYHSEAVTLSKTTSVGKAKAAIEKRVNQRPGSRPSNSKIRAAARSTEASASATGKRPSNSNFRKPRPSK